MYSKERCFDGDRNGDEGMTRRVWSSKRIAERESSRIEGLVARKRLVRSCVVNAVLVSGRLRMM